MDRCGQFLYLPAAGGPRRNPTPFDVIFMPVAVASDDRSTHNNVISGIRIYTGAAQIPNKVAYANCPNNVDPYSGIKKLPIPQIIRQVMVMAAEEIFGC